MHKTIRAIVYAKTKDEGLSKANTVFEQLTENGHVFDYFSTFDEDSATSSFGDIPQIALANSHAGQKLIDEGWKYTKEEIIEALEKVRRIVKLPDEELLKDDKLLRNDMADVAWSWSWPFSIVGDMSGFHRWLFDQDGTPISDEKHLQHVLNKWKCLYEDRNQLNPNKNNSVWVVPADVHF